MQHGLGYDREVAWEGSLSKSLKGLRIWDRDGKLRQTGLAPPPAGLPSLDEQVKQALAGEVVVIPYENGADSLECVLAPLVDATGRPDGAAAVMIDAGERRQVQARLRERLAFEELITTLSTQVISLAPDAVDEGVTAALGAIGEFARVDRAYVFRFTSDGAAMTNTHEWCAPGIESVMDIVQNLPIEVFPWWTDRLLRARETVHVPDISLLPPEAAAEKGTLTEQGVQSILALPMIHEGVVAGFLGFDSVATKKTWPDADVALLRIAGEIIVSALERKRAEESRRALETQLIQARSLENVARLAGGVAHDFNNLLAVILNYASLLRNELVEDEQREKIGELYEAARRAAELTRQLLVVGRRDIVEPMLLDLNTVVTSLDRLVRQALGESIQLRLELDNEIGLVRIGLPQLEQIVLNLTMNARDAMPRGGVLEIQTSEVDLDPSYAARYIDVKPGRYLRLRVNDNGSGMTSEVALRAFEPFFTTKENKGTGLGLSTVYGIVKQAGGHVILSSEPDVGTKVDVFFPIVGEGVAADIRPLPPEDAPKGRGETVLVVEDSANVRKLVCAMLRGNGYQVLEARSAPDALALFEQHRGTIDVLLTDVIMPQMSGRDLALRARGDYALSKILFMSGYDDEIIAHQGSLEPGTQLLKKPFLEADLLRSVRRVIEADQDQSRNSSRS
ncbi:MAG: sensory box histidine kinase/response regulator [Labilithrix sp.]|nr:sensory box histidine kinase/response regulator [Labilithrix sp.]